MTLTERTTIIGLIAGLVTFIAYLSIVITRAATDGLPLTEVAWHGPLLLTLLIGGGAYGLFYGYLAWRVRGQRSSDVRDKEIMLHAETAGAGLSGLVVLAALIMLGFKVDTFWVVHVLFIGSYLASVINAAVTITGYRKGIQA